MIQCISINFFTAPADVGGKLINTYTLYQLQSKDDRVIACKNSNNYLCKKITYKGKFNRDLLKLDQRGEPFANRIGGVIQGHDIYQDSIVSGFKCDTNYFFMIIASNDVGDGHMANENESPVGFRTKPCSKPSQMITPLLIERKTTSIVVDWVIPSNDDHVYDLGGADVEYFEIQKLFHHVTFS